MIYLIQRRRDDGRMSFYGERFVNNVIETTQKAAADEAISLGWRVTEKYEPTKVDLTPFEKPAPSVVVADNVCPVCNKVFKNANGVRFHSRTHKE